MKPTTNTKKMSRGVDEKLVKEYIEVKNREHCQIVGQDCVRCSVACHCVHKK